MRETAAQYGVRDPTHPTQNIEVSACFLRRLIAKYGGGLRGRWGSGARRLRVKTIAPSFQRPAP
jgi:hypothetical protein